MSIEPITPPSASDEPAVVDAVLTEHELREMASADPHPSAPRAGRSAHVALLLSILFHAAIALGVTTVALVVYHAPRVVIESAFTKYAGTGSSNQTLTPSSDTSITEDRMPIYEMMPRSSDVWQPGAQPATEGVMLDPVNQSLLGTMVRTFQPMFTPLADAWRPWNTALQSHNNAINWQTPTRQPNMKNHSAAEQPMPSSPQQ